MFRYAGMRCANWGVWGPHAISAILIVKRALDDPDGTTALWALCALARIEGDPAGYLPLLIKGLQEKKRVFPGMASAALAELGPKAAPAVDTLLAELNAPHPDDRWSAAGALAAIGPEARAAVPALVRVLREDHDEKVRWYAAWALGQIGKDSAPAVPPLIAALDDPDADVRGYAARALGSIGAEARSAIPKLRELLPLEEGLVQTEMRQTLEILTAIRIDLE